MGVAVQKIRKEYESQIETAVKYYSIVSILNDLKLSHKLLQLLAFTAIRGTITPKPARLEFIEMFDSSLPSLENMKGELYRKGLLVKVKEMYRVNPLILPDFSQEMLIVQLNLEIKEKEEHGEGESTRPAG